MQVMKIKDDGEIAIEDIIGETTKFYATKNRRIRKSTMMTVGFKPPTKPWIIVKKEKQ